MDRQEELIRSQKFLEFLKPYANVTYMIGNVPKIYKNLEKAEKDGCLRKFLLNDRAYQSAFIYNAQGFRPKDQVAIVMALNIYGMEHPGFAQRLNQQLKELAKTKYAACVTVLMAAQLELQREEVSLIDFVDRELIELVNRDTRKRKTRNILLCVLFIHAMVGGYGLSVFCAMNLTEYALILGLPFMVGNLAGIIGLVKWCCFPMFKQTVIEASAREPGNRVTEIPQSVCPNCGYQAQPDAKFCGKCGMALK